ncbi:MAG: sulfite exporter TauE/SafE family protein [Hyphomicrobiales bacterium]|nr:sulfite exporter TauE/SafE family protein [Hyphomicrobiales bacterium]
MYDLILTTGHDPALYSVAFLIIVVGATAQSTLGIGLGVVAAPAMALLDPRMVPGPLLVLALLTSLMVVIRDRRDLRFGHLSYALSGRVPASILGGLTAGALGQRDFLLLFAGLVIAAVALSLTGWKIAPTRRNLFLAGSASGYMGTITSAGGAPMAIVYQHSPAAEVRANMSAFFFAGALVSIGSLIAFGAFDWAELAFAIYLIPALWLGFFLSRYFRAFADNGWMRPSMLVLCGAAAATLVVRALAM